MSQKDGMITHIQMRLLKMGKYLCILSMKKI